MRIDADKLLKDLDRVTDGLIALAEPIDSEEALSREREICDMARQFGIALDLPESALDRGLALAQIEQKCRMKKAGVTYMGKKLTAVYSIPTLSDDVTTELIFDYTEKGELKRAYTRTVNRNGDRWAIGLNPEKAAKLEQLFALSSREFLQPAQKQRKGMRM